MTVWSVAAAAPGNLDHESKGKEAESCLCPTTDDLLYVCGTDGRTYSNISELKCELTCGRSGTYRHQCKSRLDGHLARGTRASRKADWRLAGAEPRL